MLPWCLPPSFCSIWLTVQEQITTEDFQMVTMPAILDTILMEMSKMWKVTDGHMVAGQTSKAPGELTIEDLQDGCCGGHLGYRNKMVLAILNLHVTQMPPCKFWLNLTYHSGEKLRFEEFQDGHLEAILYIGTERFQQFWICVSLWCLPSRLGLICITVWEEM